MKWSFVIEQKLKAALILGGVMLLVIVGALITRKQMEGMDRSFASIYKDRLVPAATITYLAEHIYAKRLSLETYLLSPGNARSSDLASDLHAHDTSIDSLLFQFEKTYIVESEAKSLSALKNRVKEYRLLEEMVLNMYRAGNVEEGRKLFEGAGAQTFRSAISRLNELTTIQTDIGMQLVSESRSNVAGFSTVSFLQIAVAVIAGLLMLVLIQSSGITNRPKHGTSKSGGFHLN